MPKIEQGPMPLIEPDTKHRFTNHDIRGWHGTAETAFHRGDFMLAAEMAEKDSSLQYAAYVMAGLVDKGIAGLASLPSPSDIERLILAFGLWLSDKIDEAEAVLESDFADGPLRATAERLGRLVSGERTPVLLTMDIYDHQIETSATMGQFFVRPVATQRDRGEADLVAGVDIAAYIAGLPISEKPAFVLTAFNHWVAPGGLDRLDVPCVRWHHDEDTQFHRSYDTYGIYDLNLVSTTMQHFELSTACGNFWVSNLFMHPNDTSYRIPEPSAKKHDIDVLMTGSALDDFHSEKARLIFSIARGLPPTSRIVTVHGHLPGDEYRDLTQRARFMPVMNRVAGSPSPRWHEALESGAILLYPRGTFYGHVSKGALPFDPDDPAAAIANYLAQPPGALPDPVQIASAVTRDLEHYRRPWEKRFEWLLKYCCFLLSARSWLNYRLPEPAAAVDGASLSTPRVRFVWSTPSVDVTVFPAEPTHWRMRRLAELRGLPADADAADINNLATTRLRLAIDARRLAAATGDKANYDRLVAAATEDREVAHSLLAEGRRRYPQHLVFRFNDIQWRMIWRVLHNEQSPTSEWRDALEQLLRDEPNLIFNPFGCDVGTQVNSHHDRIFPYFRYSQTVLASAVSRATGVRSALADEPRTIVRAATIGYLGWAWHMEGRADEAAKCFARSLDLFPNNQPLSHFQLEVLRAIASGAGPGAQVAAAESVEAFLRCAAIYPVTLLTHLADMLPLIEQSGRDDILPELLSDWYRFAAALHPQTFAPLISTERAYEILRATKRHGKLVDGHSRSLVSSLMGLRGTETGWFRKCARQIVGLVRR